jgi:hypothetical protein
MGFEVVKQDGVYYVDGSLIQEIMAKIGPQRCGFHAALSKAA